ncbi:hypothetical protein MCC93_24160 [Morococcus cerebrosus]|uniref:Uncharacterized protein n=1 Tax=Morococcus cerebrosus TaxID=1056807 RepID=A0A0C1GWE8_9NEIS|nr:hypothetical protein MCC93_24160 [Morococcus cerebrosus]
MVGTDVFCPCSHIKRSSERFERDPLDSFADDLFVCGKVNPLKPA